MLSDKEKRLKLHKIIKPYFDELEKCDNPDIDKLTFDIAR